DQLVPAMAAIVGAPHVLTDPDLTAGYTSDWTGRFAGRTPAVVRPADADEVEAIVRWCAAHGVAVVPQGGNTGLVGGSVPLAGEVVLSTRRLDDLGEVDAVAGQVTVGAGATLEAVQRHVRATTGGLLELAVDLAARGSATIGGMVATNAGGTKVLRHGPMRAQVAGVEAVLGTGARVAHLGGLLKDNTGYDLAGLLTGSEGTLGIVSRVRLRLVPAAVERTTALLAVDTADDAVAAFVAARAGGPDLEAAELVFADGVALVCDHLGIAEPFAGRHHGAYLLLEAAAADDPTERLLAALGPAAARIADTAIATTASRREELWRHREAHTEAINALGIPHKLDVTLPLGRLAAFCTEVRELVDVTHPGCRTFLFGHVGDGNVHVNIVGPLPDDDAVDDAVLRLVAERGGSISAEHGIGTAKRAHLHLARSPAEIATFRRLKAALDPAGILNPAVLLPPVAAEE
ncbi:MAG TPA: FAD-binding oxidoreductase, partial [Acidimicrobiales bacterium]|nr:FAD-binding oxidoreductase [Acidimicrobiales bacterium]